MVQRISRRRSATALRRAEEGESVRTIVIALLANVVIAVAKLIGGLVARSTGMLAEAAHSAADSVNEIFLAVGLQRDRQPPTDEHPFGRGRERYLWAFLAAIASFLIGGCLSIMMAIGELRARRPVVGGLVAWIILGVAFVADSVSWLQTLRQARQQAADYQVTVWRYIVRSSDPVIRAVFFEDSAAVIGLVIAAAGLLFTGILGSSVPDAMASLLIGLLLAVTALGVGRSFADFLIGRSLAPQQMERLRQIVGAHAAVEQIGSLRALYSGPEEVIVMAKIRPAPAMTAGELGRAMDELDETLRRELPLIADVFIDVTAAHGDGADREK